MSDTTVDNSVETVPMGVAFKSIGRGIGRGCVVGWKATAKWGKNVGLAIAGRDVVEKPKPEAPPEGDK